MSVMRAQALAEAAQRIGRREARELMQHACRCTHAELIAANGRYAQMWALQQREDESAASIAEATA